MCIYIYIYIYIYVYIYIYIYTYVYIYIYIYIYVYNYNSNYMYGRKSIDCMGVRPISLLRLSLLRLIDSNFPGDPPWAWEFHRS